MNEKGAAPLFHVDLTRLFQRAAIRQIYGLSRRGETRLRLSCEQPRLNRSAHVQRSHTRVISLRSANQSDYSHSCLLPRGGAGAAKQVASCKRFSYNNLQLHDGC